MIKKSSSKSTPSHGFHTDIDWELRPGGMIVQKRPNPAGDHSSAAIVTIKVSHGSHYHHHISLHPQSTFGDLKRVLWEETGLEPKDQRLLFRGKEKENEECLHMAGVNDMSKVILMEDPASKERKLQKIKKNGEEVAEIRAEVDQLSEKVGELERRGRRVEEKEVNVMTELLMVKLLKLDAIDITDGDAKLHRRNQVIRVQNLVDRLDNLKGRSTNPFNDRGDVVSFESGLGSLDAPSSMHCTTRITHDWELFD